MKRLTKVSELAGMMGVMTEQTPKLNVNRQQLDEAVQRLQKVVQGDAPHTDPFALVFEYDLTQGESVEFAPEHLQALEDSWQLHTKDMGWTPEQSAFAHQVATAYWQIFNLHHKMFNANTLDERSHGRNISDSVYTAIQQDRDLIIELNRLLTSAITRNALRDIQDPESPVHISDARRAVGLLGKIIRYSMGSFHAADTSPINFSVTSVFPQYVHKKPEELVAEAMHYPDTKLEEIRHLNAQRLDQPIKQRW